MDSDSDIEIVPNSIDDPWDTRSLGSSSASGSNAELQPVSCRKRGLQQAPSSSHTSSSDIELVAGPSAVAVPPRGAGTDLTNTLHPHWRKPLTGARTIPSTSPSSTKSRGSAGVGGFKSAAAIFRDEAKKERLGSRRRSSSPGSDAAAASTKTDAYFASRARLSSESDIKGKRREDSLPPPLSVSSAARQDITRELEDEDDGFLELPPPLQKTANLKSVSPAKASLAEGESEREQSESPGAAFRLTLNKFKAPAPTFSCTSGSRPASSLFSGRTARPNASFSSIVLSDSSLASASASTTSTARRARSIFTTSAGDANTANQLQLPIPFLAVITKCPTCNDMWTVAKEPKTKLNHIRKCAAQRVYSDEDVGRLVEEQVRSLHDSAQEKNRKHHDDRTLFEGLLSKKGKEVQVVGVENKKKESRSGRRNNITAQERLFAEEDRYEGNSAQPPVLATQGGSTYSQATSTQVQVELNKRIKANQKIERGHFLNVSQTAQSYARDNKSRTNSDGSANESTFTSQLAGQKSILAEAASRGRKAKGKANASGIGSKNWLKAAQLLKAKESEATTAVEELETPPLVSTAHIGTSITSALGPESSKGKHRASSAIMHNSRLESYMDSRHRLAGKIKEIAAARTRQNDSSAESDYIVETDGPVDALDDETYLQRPYRNPSDLDISLLDRAIRIGTEKKKQGYDAWALAGSREDTVKNRDVSPTSSPPTTPPAPYKSMSRSTLPGDNHDYGLLSSVIELPHSSSPVGNALSPAVSSPLSDYPAAAPPSSPPIGKLSLSSTPESPIVNSPTIQHTGAQIHICNCPHTCSDQTVPSDRTAQIAGTSGSLLSNNTAIVADSSSGLSKSLAALQALTQKLKATSSSSTNPALARRAARMGLHSAVLPSVITESTFSSVHTVHRSYSAASGQEGDGLVSGKVMGSDDVYELLLSSQETEATPTKSKVTAATDVPKKPRGRPRKDSPVALGISPEASPKRKKKDDDGSHTSETDRTASVSSKQGTLAFKAAKKAKSVTSTATKKTVTSDRPSPRKKKAATLPSDSAIPLTNLYPGIPDYESWSKEKLQAETGKYGYKPAGTKKVLVAQLVRVWQAIHPDSFPVPAKPESVPPWRARSRSASPEAISSSVKCKTKQAKLSSDIEEDHSVHTSSQPVKSKTRKGPASTAAKKTRATTPSTSAKGKAIAAARAKRKASVSRSIVSDIDDDPDDEDGDVHADDTVGEDDVDLETAPEDLKTAGERLREVILEDEKFYLRILRYEPIQFDDFEMILAACQIKMSKIALRDWLDSQGIVFYYDQTTGRNAKRNGARQRHA